MTVDRARASPAHGLVHDEREPLQVLEPGLLLDPQGPGLHSLLLQPLRGATYAAAQATLLKMAVEGPVAEHDLMLHVAETLRTATQGQGAAHVVVGGVSNLTDEAQQMRRETLRMLFQTLERETEMLRVLQDVASSSDDPAVTIGGEHPTTGEWEASLITAPFHAGDQTVGTIGVVGPTRMDYLSAMASVRAVAHRLSELATELEK